MIYISGQITGKPDYRIDFERGIYNLKKAGLPAHEIINPLEIIPYNRKETWRHYMIADIRVLVTCDAIYMLKGWRKSKGARLERYIAKKLNMAVIYE